MKNVDIDYWYYINFFKIIRKDGIKYLICIIKDIFNSNIIER